jgi:hypothetical protein
MGGVSEFILKLRPSPTKSGASLVQYMLATFALSYLKKLQKGQV